jgi:hypothetical protein
MRSAPFVRTATDPSVQVRMMFAESVLAYLVVACATFVWMAKQMRIELGENPQVDAVNRIAPKSWALMIASICLLVAIFWPVSLVVRAVIRAIMKRAEKEIRDDDDDDDGMPQGA